MGYHCFVLCLQMSFAPGKKFPSIASLLRFFFHERWLNLSHFFCVYLDMIFLLSLSFFLVYYLYFYWQAKFAFLGQNPLKIVSFPIYYTIPVGNTVLLETFPPVFKRRY